MSTKAKGTDMNKLVLLHFAHSLDPNIRLSPD